MRYMFQDPAERIKDELLEMGMPMTHEDLEYIEHRVYHDYVGTVDYGIEDPNTKQHMMTRSW
jgi:hypothetical protein